MDAPQAPDSKSDSPAQACARCGRPLAEPGTALSEPGAPVICARCVTFLAHVRQASLERGVYFAV